MADNVSHFKRITAKDASDNWVLFKVPDGKTSLEFVGTGNGLSALHDALDPACIMFAALRVSGVDEQASVTSRRDKVVQINWVGNQVPAKKRSGALAAKQEATSLFQGAASNFDGNSADDLSHETLGKKLLASGGAHKPSFYDFGNNEKYELPPKNE